MIILVLVVLGLCLGSFTNALVWRLHEQEGKSKAERAKLSVVKGRSMCTHCHHVLGFWDLAPVFSWLWLRGKCRYCHKPIVDTPLAELLTPLLFVVSYWWWPLGWSHAGVAMFALWLAIMVVFMALTLYDWRWQLLPNRLVYPAGFLAAALTGLNAWSNHQPSILLDAALGVLCLWGLFYVLFQVSGGRWIGGGDVRLGFVLGLLVGGPRQAFLVLFLASLLGTLVSFPALLQKHPQLTKRVPFGPFLIVAAIVAFLWGGRLESWYLNHLLLL